MLAKDLFGNLAAVLDRARIALSPDVHDLVGRILSSLSQRRVVGEVVPELSEDIKVVHQRPGFDIGDHEIGRVEPIVVVGIRGVDTVLTSEAVARGFDVVVADTGLSICFGDDEIDPSIASIPSGQGYGSQRRSGEEDPPCNGSPSVVNTIPSPEGSNSNWTVSYSSHSFGMRTVTLNQWFVHDGPKDSPLCVGL